MLAQHRDKSNDAPLILFVETLVTCSKMTEKTTESTNHDKFLWAFFETAWSAKSQKSVRAPRDKTGDVKSTTGA